MNIKSDTLAWKRVRKWLVILTTLASITCPQCVQADDSTFAYNDRSEIIGATCGGAVFQWKYDSVGNRKWMSINNFTNHYLVNNLNQYVAVTTSTGTNALFTYDLDGNTLTEVTAQYQFSHAWDAENRLVSTSPIVHQNGARMVENQYDHLHRRVRKTVKELTGFDPEQPNSSSNGIWTAISSTLYVYDQYRLLLERSIDPNGATNSAMYVWGKDMSGTLDGAGGIGGLLAVSLNGTYYFPFYDGTGNIIAYVTDSGDTVAEYLYDPYGVTLQKGGPMADVFHFRYSTKYYDTETGLYDFGRRFYRPTLGRWINRDPSEEEGGIHLYRYVANNPINEIDPDGQIPFDTIWDLVNIVYDIAVGDDVSLAADTAALMIPYLPAGTTKLVNVAKLAKVSKICPNARSLQVTYYSRYAEKHFKLSKTVIGKSWISATRHGHAQFKPGFTHEQAKVLIDKALQTAKSQGKVRPRQIDKFVCETGEMIGASNGKETSKIILYVTDQGTIHVRPID